MTRFAHEESPTVRDKMLDEIAAQVKRTANLDDLLATLVAFENVCREIDDETGQESDTERELDSRGCNITQLPTFGGPDPENTTGVWSWDGDNVLMGEGSFSDWHIEPREVLEMIGEDA